MYPHRPVGMLSEDKICLSLVVIISYHGVRCEHTYLTDLTILQFMVCLRFKDRDHRMSKRDTDTADLVCISHRRCAHGSTDLCHAVSFGKIAPAVMNCQEFADLYFKSLFRSVPADYGRKQERQILIFHYPAVHYRVVMGRHTCDMIGLVFFQQYVIFVGIEFRQQDKGHPYHQRQMQSVADTVSNKRRHYSEPFVLPSEIETA